MKLTLESFQVACATETYMEFLWPISPGVCMVSAVPSAEEPCRREAPEAWQQASISVVFPEPPCPTTTQLRIRSVVKLGDDAIRYSWIGGWGGGPAKGAMSTVPAPEHRVKVFVHGRSRSRKEPHA